MRLLWEEEAWEDYCLWQTRDKKLLKRINDTHRIVYREQDGNIIIASCYGHYTDT